MPETRLATNVCGCCKTAITTGQDGAIYVAFRNIYPGSLRDISFAVSRDDGRTFSPPVRVSEDHWMLDGCPDDGPTIAVDHDGVVHLVWPTLVEGPEPAIGLFHASTRDGGHVHPPAANRHPRIAEAVASAVDDRCMRRVDARLG